MISGVGKREDTKSGLELVGFMISRVARRLLPCADDMTSLDVF